MGQRARVSRLQVGRWLLIVAVIATGCAGYRPAPLTPQGVAQRLAPPDSTVLRLTLAEWHHPLLPPLAYDPRDGLSPDEAAVYAVVANPELRATRARHGVAAAALLAAGLLPNPQLDYQVDVPLGSKVSGEIAGHALGISFDLGALIGRGTERRAAREDLASVEWEVAWAEWQVAQEARLQARRIPLLEQVVALTRQQVQVQQESEARLVRGDSLGLVTAADAAAGAAALDEARQASLAAAQALTSARLALDEALGLAAATPVTMQAQPDAETDPLPPPVDSLLAGLEARRLDLVALRHGYASQDATLRSAVLGQVPSIGFGAVQTRDTGGFFTLGPAVTLALPFFDHGQAAVAREQATREELYREYAARLFAARQEISRLGAEYRSAVEQLAVWRAAVPLRQRLVEAYERARLTNDAGVEAWAQARVDLLGAQAEVVRGKLVLTELETALQVASGFYVLPAQGESR